MSADFVLRRRGVGGSRIASNSKDQTVRLGMKSGLHIMYLCAEPFVVEMLGEDWTFGLVYGSGKYSYSYIDTSSSGSTT